jgi:myo-inositol 2-dehydrogenase/D-chiro-inositol 1-dehydrogenase
LVGEAGAVQMAAPIFSRLDARLAQSTGYDADWRGRYAEAYRRQNRDFIRFAKTGLFPAIASDAWDGYAAALVAEAGVRALSEGRKVAVEMIEKPEFYK